MQGYQVKISASKKFKKSKTVTKNVKKNVITFKITGGKLKNKKKLYVKARVYVTQKKKKYYGLWSKVKTSKLK